ncbi:MAG: hypothetical protein Q9195_008238 [Heterodermia aff. obscurata]
MHSPVLITLRTAAGRTNSSACRHIAGRRFPISKRPFHVEQRRRQQNDPTEPSDVPETAQNHDFDHGPPSQPAENQEIESEEVPERFNSAPPNTPSSTDPSPYGSAWRRAFRNHKRPPISPPQLPSWFIDGNVTLWEDNALGPAGLHPGGTGRPKLELSRSLGLFLHGLEKVPISTEAEGGDQAAPGAEYILPHDENSDEDALYSIDAAVYLELQRMISAGLNIPRDPDNASSSRPHLVLNCPQQGGTFFLDFLVQDLALNSESDVVRIDAQDIAEIGGRYIRDLTDTDGNPLSVLGYETHLKPPREAREIEVDDEEEDHRRLPKSRVFAKLIPIQLPVEQLSGTLQSLANNLPGRMRGEATSQNQFAEATKDSKLSLFMEAFVTAAQLKRKNQPTLGGSDSTTAADDSNGDHPASSSDYSFGDSKVATSSSPDDNSAASSDVQDTNSTLDSPPKLIIHIRDYHEINTTPNGNRILERLHEVVQRKRGEGQKVIVIGTTISKDLLPPRSRSGSLRAAESDRFTRTILTPFIGPSADSRLAKEARDRRVDINLRHIWDMLRRISPNLFQTKALLSKTRSQMDPTTFLATILGDRIWSMSRVHRVTTLALGKLKENEQMSVKDIEDALRLTWVSDSSKARFLKKQAVHGKEGSSGSHHREPRSSPIDTEKPPIDTIDRMKKLRARCDKRERKLMHGVIDPSAIRTTFTDVRAPPETIEALKTLTSLSLVRPDAFTYGVLATDRIPGLLLYGPPGTGKTLLAKAVAKESGATMLEVSGSDIYDMYVGEGEKNVRSIFSLAKKLAPCVVFIDEADAILGSRSASHNRTTHRELITQFLREWDGMTEMNAFIMVATNRPFDLDEATLRRLPRRLLVDLPTEKDREAILGIHLKDELLAEDVSLFTLAAQTPFYSGSDLKNLAVAAALACVREELEVAAEAAKKSSSTPPDSDSASPSLSPPLDNPGQENSPDQGGSSDPETSLDQETNLDQEPSLDQDNSIDQETSFDQENKVDPETISRHTNILNQVKNQIGTFTLLKQQIDELKQLNRELQTPPQEKQQPEPPLKSHPPKRILQVRHFDRALEEISASVNEDMKSLGEIRKFDEKYGDRRGRRKRVGGYGFGTVREGEKGGGGARVRSLV